MTKCHKCGTNVVSEHSRRSDAKRRRNPERLLYQNAYRRGMYDGLAGNPRKKNEHAAYGVAYDTAAARRTPDA